MSGFYVFCFSCNEFSGLGQHALQRRKVRRIVFGQGSPDLFREGRGIVSGRLDFRFRPAEMPGHGGRIRPVTAQEQHDLPHREGAPLNAGLPSGG